MLIVTHPTPWEFHPVHHPSYIDFFEQVLAETTDPIEIEQRYEKQFAEDEWYRHLYRTSYAYHGVHPFYMWYWGCHALEHLGRVIVVGGEPKAVRRLGFKPASTMADAFEMAVRRRRAAADHHPPAQPADRHGRRDLMPRSAGPLQEAGASEGGHRRDGAGAASAIGRPSLAAATSKLPFPYRAPTVPQSVEPLLEESTLGAHYDTDWARRFPARWARTVILESALRPAVRVLADPTRRGYDRLAGLEGPVIFAANHHSHVDAGLLLTSLPEPWRYKVFAAAAADYFFVNRVTAAAAALALGAIPIERSEVTRRSADQSAELIEDGWSMVIFPRADAAPTGGARSSGWRRLPVDPLRRARGARSTSRAPAPSCRRARTGPARAARR